MTRGKRRTRKGLRLTALAGAICSTILWLSCAGTPKASPEYIVPAIDFPDFPPPSDALFDEEAGTVTVPLEWFAAVARYKIGVDEARGALARIESIYKEEARK